ncbi:MAG: hypothetical protein KAV68_06625 [Dehalococcoidales bacterium]|nr:hypothetical protein [Dehalococcoidales bacterium]
MKFLKGLALAILGFLLSLSLIVFGFTLTINQTILNPDFVASQVDSLDIPSLAEEVLREQIPQGQEYMSEVVAEAATDTIAEQELWIKQQARDGIYAFYDYLEGRSQSLSVTISIESIKESLRDNLWEAVLASPPPELEGLPPAEVEQAFNQFWSEFSEEIPSTLELDESLLDAEVMEQLEQAREIVGYIHLTYKALIALSLLLILLIVLLYRKVRGSTRQIGITFLTCGIISYVGALITKSIAGTQLTQLDMPVYLQTWIPQLIKDALAPLEIYGIGLMAAGVVLLVVSFVYKRGEPSL